MLLTIVLMLGATPLHAHEINTAIAQLNLQQNNGLHLSIRASLETLLGGTGNSPEGTDSAEHGERYQQLRELSPESLKKEAQDFIPEFLSSIQITSDQGPVQMIFKQVNVPALDDPGVMRESTIEFTGLLPKHAQELHWHWDAVNGPVILRVDDKAGEALHSVYLSAGEKSNGIRINSESSLSMLDVIKNYTYSGLIHIIPRGLDHILFVLGLFLFSPRWRPLLLQVTIFTLAHTITLALGSTGFLQVSSALVEPLIALSLVFVALENIWRQKIQVSRLLIIFVFGLLHGLWFASVLAEVGLNKTHFLAALLSFNIGVELGQLVVLAVALLSVHW
ncbi:MAG: HupE/UreJ family protein, partial [Granulosicoccus sp.]|nr:HupE/UreJ family protein [Granulosicoccus sp.]